jgi:SAM-dependent methyltransferase
MQQSGFALNPNHKSLDDLKAAFGNRDFQVDLGCGYYKPAGFIGIDSGLNFSNQTANEANAPDISMDLDRNDIPLPDNSCAVVRASHFLEHSSNIDHILFEAHRLLKPDGRFVIIVPYANSAEGMFPGHQIFLSEIWFRQHVHFVNNFEIVDERYDASKCWQALPLLVRCLIPFSFARRFFFNACCQMELQCRPKGKG